MGVYAKITEIELTNFMSIATAKIPFNSIISLCGYNDQGKSAVRTAFEIIFYDAYSNDQAKYIKDGEDYFIITLRFADGVQISKEKRLTGQSIWKMQQNGTMLYTNEATNGNVFATEDVPEPIAVYLGVYYDEATGQELNVRKDRDSYFLVDMSGGDNYKLLNPLLHSETLAKASELLLKDSNVCKIKIDDTATRVETLEQLLYTKKEIPVTVLEKLDDLIQQAGSAVTAQEQVEQLNTLYNEIESLKVAPMVETVDTAQLQLIRDLVVTKELQEQKLYVEIQLIDAERLELLQELDDTNKERQNLTANTEEIALLDAKRLTDLSGLQEISEQVIQYTQAVNRNTEQAAQIAQQLMQIKQALSNAGYKVCKNCGSIVE